MKNFNTPPLLFLLFITLFFGCEKPELVTLEDEKIESFESSQIGLKFNSIKDYQNHFKTLQKLSFEERVIFEKQNNYQSLGTLAEIEYFNVDFNSFQTKEELISFVESNDFLEIQMNELGEEVIEPIYSDFVGRYLTDKNGFLQIENDIFKVEKDKIIKFSSDKYNDFILGKLNSNEISINNWNQHGFENTNKRCGDFLENEARSGSESIKMRVNSYNRSHGGWIDGGWYYNTNGWSIEHEFIAIARNRVLGAWVRAIRTITVEVDYSFSYRDPINGLVEENYIYYEKNRAYTIGDGDLIRVNYSFGNSPGMKFTSINSRANQPNTPWVNLICN